MQLMRRKWAFKVKFLAKFDWFGSSLLLARRVSPQVIVILILSGSTQLLHYYKFIIMLHNHQPRLMALSETWLSQNAQVSNKVALK